MKFFYKPGPFSNLNQVVCVSEPNHHHIFRNTVTNWLLVVVDTVDSGQCQHFGSCVPLKTQPHFRVSNQALVKNSDCGEAFDKREHRLY